MASRSIICWSRRPRQMIDLRDTDKSRYFAITKFNKRSIIRSPSLFFKEYLREVKRSAIFAQSDRKKEKRVVSLRMSRILFAAKQSWTTLRTSRPLFVGGYLQATWWALDQWKEEKFATNDNNTYLYIYFSNTILDWKVGRFAMSLVFGKRKKFQSLAGFELMGCQNTGWATGDLVVNYYRVVLLTANEGSASKSKFNGLRRNNSKAS